MTKPERDYSETLFLPQKEPELLARWEQAGLYKQLRAAAKGREKFILHDGPPYANGNIHIGHALNKILKDVVTRSQQMLGFDSNYVPGWDCHGLPIEWKIEEENYRSKNKPKPDFSNPAALVEFRQECRAFAQKWIDVQRAEFKRLGVEGDWDNPYTTMSFAAEAQIARELMKFAANGTLYRGSKPVMWSVVEKTALAEAEVEYEDYTSDTVWVKFPVLRSGGAIAWGGEGPWRGAEDKVSFLLTANVVIWTTTPWTLPGNRAISFSPKISYGLYEVTKSPDENWAKVGEKFILADKLAEDVFKVTRVEEYARLGTIHAAEISKLICKHPLADFNSGYSFHVPLLAGDHVTDDAGTGFVHTAPGHGREDFDVWTEKRSKLEKQYQDYADLRAKKAEFEKQAGQSHDIWTDSKLALEARGINPTIPYTVDENGAFTEAAPGFTGERVINDKGEKGKANEAVIKALIDAHMLIARGRLKHQYPHSWRSKKPIIFRNTPQWFIAMDKPIAGLPSSPLPLGEVGTPLARSRASSTCYGVPGEGLRSLDRPEPPHPTPPNSALAEFGSNDRQSRINPTLAASTSPQRGEVKEGTLRARALHAIEVTRWVPTQGQNRITGMIESRPDWVISRQRAWGVPIAVFIKEKPDGSVELLDDQEISVRVVEAFEAEGADAWYKPGAAERFLGKRAAEGWKKVDDILDVWFDSGSTHAFVLEDPQHFPTLAGIARKVDGGRDSVMYLEGSDQHRGWFHSSLLESCGTRGRAPYDVVLTHGFVLDEQGRKMSKSLGNVTAPQDVIKQSGADILRMWVCASDYADDLRIGPEILKTTADTYRKLRNTIRWMLGSLAHFHEEDRVKLDKMPELERLMLHRLSELDVLVRQAYTDFDYKRIFAALSNFMTADLSAFYFDIRKDTLYCDPISSVNRKACLTVVDHLFRCTVTWLAPMLCFTAEESWASRYGADATSVHLETFHEVPAAWRDDKLAEKWRKVRGVRRVVTGALEIERAQKRIGSSLEAHPIVHVANPELFEAVLDIDLAEVCITSAATLVNDEGPADGFRLPDVAGVAVVSNLAVGTKCARSWKILTSIGADPEYPDVSPRDAKALREWETMRKAAE